jgi:hypothetical protein
MGARGAITADTVGPTYSKVAQFDINIVIDCKDYKYRRSGAPGQTSPSTAVPGSRAGHPPVAVSISSASGTASPERRFKDGCVTRHRKFGESFTRYARQRVEGVSLAVFPHDVVEKGPELGVAQLHAGIRYGLYQRREITFGSNSDPRVVENFEVSSLLPEFCDARFQRLIQR